MINKKMAAILGADLPSDDLLMEMNLPVEPHEIVRVDNPDLPPMQDIERKHLQAEKQLEEVIAFTLGYQRDLFNEVAQVDPKYRSRYIEVANGTLGIALEAIKTKLKTQENRKKQRLDEAEFRTESKADQPGTTNNFFFGSREDLIKAIRSEPKDEENS